MKLADNKKKLMKDAAIWGGAVALAAGLYMAASAFRSSAEQKKNTIAGQVSQQQSEITNLKNKIEMSGGAAKRYVAIVHKRGNESFVINNDKVREVLEALVKRHRVELADKVEYSAEKLFRHSELTAVTTPIVVRQEARMRFEALSDAHAIAFVESLSRELPGIIRFTKISLQRKEPLSLSTMTALVEGKTPYTTEGDIAFDWFGIKAVQINATQAAEPPVGMP